MSVNNTSDSPVPCANSGCTFFGRPSTGNFCSKCYNDLKKNDTTTPKVDTKTEETKEKEKVVEEKVKAEEVEAKKEECAAAAGNEQEDDKPKRKEQKNKKRCFSCNKKVGLTGIECRCGYIFCSKHRFPNKHECDFDFKAFGRKELEKRHVGAKASSLQDKL